MSDAKIINEKNRTEMKNGAAERAEAVRAEADRIASQILTLTRNGLFVSLRFLDLALCQFEYINSEKIRGIATTGQHIVYNSQYVIESYMKDRQSLSRDYLHMVLHCVFRHPFVSENLHEEYWNLAADIAVETIIDELDLKQTSTNDCDEVREEVARIEKTDASRHRGTDLSDAAVRLRRAGRKISSGGENCFTGTITGSGGRSPDRSQKN